jgi:hypothetical protein
MFLSGIFALTAFFCFAIVVRYLRMDFFSHAAVKTPLTLFSSLLVPVIFSAMGVVFAVAWWTSFREKSSARGWGIAASIVNILVTLLPAVLALRFDHGAAGIAMMFPVMVTMLSIGVLGLVAFGRKIEAPDQAELKRQIEALPGDGTLELLNRFSGLLFCVLSYSLYSQWLRWCWNHDISLPTGGITGMILWLTLLSLGITLLHELGHTITGVALGMKLRVFYVGPFQWRNQSGKWAFKFVPQEIMMAGGATSVVPATTEFPAWRYVVMIAAGPLINLVAGVGALWIVYSSDMETAGTGTGILALFGVYSVASFVWNLIPIRTQMLYSDGARIYQHISGGPWGEFNKSISFVQSSLVTAVRPRDYEIATIERAAAGITRGPQGMLLRLYKYGYLLDRGEMTEAGAALQEAGRVCLDSAPNIPGLLYTEFVFGAAFVLRDATAARQWWERMDVKKLDRFSVDYWRAKSALHWIEGNLKESNEAWEKSNIEAQKLPQAGAYEFDRYLCSLLRGAIDASAAG